VGSTAHEAALKGGEKILLPELCRAGQIVF